jgi:hypothetical protein
MLVERAWGQYFRVRAFLSHAEGLDRIFRRRVALGITLAFRSALTAAREEVRGTSGRGFSFRSVSIHRLCRHANDDAADEMCVTEGVVVRYWGI